MVPKQQDRGSITLICGSMFSGKTEELIRLVRRAMHARKRVQVFKSSLDSRCETTVIRTHDGICFNAQTVSDAQTLESLLDADVQVVGIEEVQFFDDAIVPLCQRLADRGIQVIAAGLDQDFRGLPFGFMPTLMALADNVLKLHAICKVCGEEASRTQRLVNGRPAAWDEPTIVIGADETYEARCRHCHQVRKVPRGFRLTPPRAADNGISRSDATGQAEGAVRSLAGSVRAKSARNGKQGAQTVPERQDASTSAGVEEASQLEMFVDTVAEPEPGAE